MKRQIYLYLAIMLALIGGMIAVSGHEHAIFMGIGSIVFAVLVGNGLAFGDEMKEGKEDDKSNTR